MKLSFPSILIFFLFIFSPIRSQNCTNPLINYDIFDDIFFLQNSTLLSANQKMCNLKTGDYSCCSDLNINDIGVVYDKFKSRIEDYNSDWILNYKNLFNGFLDLTALGITTDVPNLSTTLKQVILEYRTEIKKLNKQQSQCVSTPVQIFAGTLCLVCDSDYSSYLRISNPEETNTTFSKYTIVYDQSNCDAIYSNCFDYLESRKNLEAKIYHYMMKLIDTLAAYVGEMPYANITLISTFFSNTSALADTNMNSRLLETFNSELETKNEEIDADLYFNFDLEDYDNITSINSTYNLDHIARGLKSSSRGSSGGRSSRSRSSGRSSSSSSSSRSSSSSTSSSSSSSGSSGGRSTYSSRTSYGARTSTASNTVKSSSTARSSFSRTTTKSAYSSSSSYRSYATTSRTYSYSRNTYLVIYGSRYGTRYRGYYYRNNYGTNGAQKLAQTNSTAGVTYKIAIPDDYQGVLSPFYAATSLPSDISSQETSYNKLYTDWMNTYNFGDNLIENCPQNSKKCRVCIQQTCFYFTKATAESYDKYCNIE